MCACGFRQLASRRSLPSPRLRYASVSKEACSVAKETGHTRKRGLLTLAYRRYAYVSKETYLNGQRDLFIWQHEEYVSVKRGLSYGKRALLLTAYLRYANINRPLLPYKSVSFVMYACLSCARKGV